MTYTNVGVAHIRPHATGLGILAPNSSQHFDRRSPPVVTGLEHFRFIFDSSVAQSPEQRLECFRLRFQAYCVDNNFLDPNEYPDGLETDADDNHCVHSLLTHRSSGNPIGTVRLLLPRADGERRMLPIQRLAGPIASDARAPFPVERTGEISRFAIMKSFRHHIPNRDVEAAMAPEEWRKMLLHLPLGLIKSCIEMGAREGLTHIAAVMEPALLRLLTRFGISFNPLGGLVDYLGQRQPCWADADVLLKRVLKERPDVWAVLTDNGRLWPSPSGNTRRDRGLEVGMHA